MTTLQLHIAPFQGKRSKYAHQYWFDENNEERHWLKKKRNWDGKVTLPVFPRKPHTETNAARASSDKG